MVDFIGRDGNVVLFSNGSDAVVVNTDLNLVVGVGEHAVLSASRAWQITDESPSESVIELANSAVTTLDINVITASARMYTIPDGAKAEAKKALEWHKEHHRGGTPVGLNTARTLAKGGQIGIEKIRHIAKYFPRHEVDKKGKGWKPGQDNFPSNGRIAWALWGGDTAWSWARSIVERENKKAVTAGGYALPGYQDSLDTYKPSNSYDASVGAFKDAHMLDENYGPEFMARVCMDGSGVDRLYKVDHDGKVCVWDDGTWDDLGHVDGDVWLYDGALDDPYDHVEKDHFIIDPESAVYISAMLQQNPYGKVRIEDMDPDEANLVANGLREEDLQMLDYALTAAGDSMSGSKPAGAVKAGDGQYTEAERSNIASQAPRDATGKFAKAGGRAVIGNDASKGSGTIVGRSSTPGNIQFKLDATGKTIDIPAKYSTPEDKFVAPKAPAVDYGKPLNVDGILGEPRTPQSMPNAQLPGTMAPMTSGDLQNVLNDWDGYVAAQRASFKPLTDTQVRQYAKDTNQKVREVGSETRTPLPGQSNNAPKGITTVKDGKLVTQSAPAPAPTPAATDTSAPADTSAPSGPTFRAQGVGKPRAYKPDDNLLPGSPNMSRVTPGNGAAPTPVKPPTGGAKTGIDVLDGIGKLFGGKKNSAPASPNPSGRKVTGYEMLPGSPNMAKPIYADQKPGPDRVERNTPEPSAPKAVAPKSSGNKGEGSSAKGGNYVVKKGDSLWSIADKYKPKGETTASYWAKVMKANPKGNFKSGNPSLIYSGEKVNLPGHNAPSTSTGKSSSGSSKPTTSKSSEPVKKNTSSKPEANKSNKAPSSNKSAGSKPSGAKTGIDALEGIGKLIGGKGGSADKPKESGKKITGYEVLPGSPNMARPTYGDKKPAPAAPKAAPAPDRVERMTPQPKAKTKPKAPVRSEPIKRRGSSGASKRRLPKG